MPPIAIDATPRSPIDARVNDVVFALGPAKFQLPIAVLYPAALLNPSETESVVDAVGVRPSGRSFDAASRAIQRNMIPADIAAAV